MLPDVLSRHESASLVIRSARSPHPGRTSSESPTNMTPDEHIAAAAEAARRAAFAPSRAIAADYRRQAKEHREAARDATRRTGLDQR